MTSPFSRRISDLPGNITMNRRRMMFGATGLALSGGLVTSNAVARQGHSPNQSVTPTAGGPSPLMAMLGMVPAGYVPNLQEIGIGWYYADIARQFDAVGLHHDLEGSDFENEPFTGALLGLMVGSNTFSYSAVEELTSAIGFQPLGVDQTLYVGAPGSQLSLFKADFYQEKLVAAWSASGYEPVDTASGIPAWTIGPEAEIAFDHPIQSMVMSELNNVAIVKNVLLYAPRLDLLEQALTFVGSGEASLASDPVFGPLIQTLPETTVSAIAMAPIGPDLGFVVLPDEEREQVETAFEDAVEAFGSMPPSTGIVSAVSEGAVALDWEWPLENGTPVPNAREHAGIAHIRMGMASPEDATQAADVAASRWNAMNSQVTLMPYTDLAEVALAESNGNVAMLDLVQTEGPRLWAQLFESRDVLPFVPV